MSASKIALLLAESGTHYARAQPKGAFVQGYRSVKLHMPRRSYAVWTRGRARLAVQAKCGVELLRATSVDEALDGHALCDWCVLADYRNCIVYRFFDAADVLLYVGFTVNFPGRLGTHHSSSPWFSEVARWTLTDLPDDVTGLAYEAETIRAERPIYNVRHNEAALAAAL
jgi:hypothetical protein